MLTLNEYQELAGSTAVYPGRGTALGLMYCGLKLAGESGEFAENIGKALRDDGLCHISAASQQAGHGELTMWALTDERHEKLKKELGDALWYISQAASELGTSLEEIARGNLAKLADRQQRGVLKGSGDNR